ncbi:protein YIF1B-B-like isoform X2 [Ipomoea triloba]|uniref:protein YIF1B-B-like isoform X2 n=1 Tax=Ipomoea triloba TaxID=35885 RepID=UPI00125DF496|nr:protein YIF1B-B-like isoform X2 [Ipomoea triloba]
MEIYENSATHPGNSRPQINPQPNPFGNKLYGASSGLIRSGLGAYGDRIFGSSSEYVQSNGHWTRITEPIGGRLSYKPPMYDINAPDLYIPLMAFGTYVVLAGFSLGVLGKFTAEALNWLFVKALLAWFVQVLLLKMSLLSSASGEAPLLDLVAYAGYTFAGMCLAVLGRVIWPHSYYFLLPWTCLCMGIFLVKTAKRVIITGHDSRKHHYRLLFIALAQFPVFVWVGNSGGQWLL